MVNAQYYGFAERLMANFSRYGPVVDGKFVRNLPDQEFKTGNFYKIPLIVDREAYEGVIFSNETDLGTSQTYETMDVSLCTFS